MNSRTRGPCPGALARTMGEIPSNLVRARNDPVMNWLAQRVVQCNKNIAMHKHHRPAAGAMPPTGEIPQGKIKSLI